MYYRMCTSVRLVYIRPGGVQRVRRLLRADRRGDEQPAGVPEAGLPYINLTDPWY